MSSEPLKFSFQKLNIKQSTEGKQCSIIKKKDTQCKDIVHDIQFLTTAVHVYHCTDNFSIKVLKHEEVNLYMFYKSLSNSKLASLCSKLAS